MTAVSSSKIQVKSISIPRRDCLLIAVVCDIRSFTDLTARVSEFCESKLVPPDQGAKLLEDYTKYIEQTRTFAEDKILAGIKCPDELSYAVKSTGDGFLVAVAVEDIRFQLDSGEYNQKWLDIAIGLTEGLCHLIEDAEPTLGAKGFGAQTTKFLNEWGCKLGFEADFDDKTRSQEHNSFRVAGAMTMGVGSLVGPTQDKSNNWLQYADAYGHPINLAFRLCHEAYRPADTPPYYSPSILFDRRIARVLLSHSPDALFDSLKEARIIPYTLPRVLKGIEEAWCFGRFKLR